MDSTAVVGQGLFRVGRVGRGFDLKESLITGGAVDIHQTLRIRHWQTSDGLIIFS